MIDKQFATDHARMVMKVHDCFHNLIVTGIADEPLSVPLTQKQVSLLIVVRNRNSINLKDLAKALRVTPPSASIMVERLVEAGLLTREPNPADRREVLIRMSPSLEKVIEPYEARTFMVLEEVFERMGEGYVKQWWDLNERLLAVLGDMENELANGKE